MAKPINLIGRRFGRLIVLDKGNYVQTCKKWLWVVRCDCGTICSVMGGALQSGITRSCGCLRKEVTAVTGKANLKHGGYRHGRESVEHRAWRHVKRFARLRGRPVVLRFDSFLQSVGSRPTEHHFLSWEPRNEGGKKFQRLQWVVNEARYEPEPTPWPQGFFVNFESL